MTLSKQQIVEAVRSGERSVVTRQEGEERCRDLGLTYALNLKDQKYEAQISKYEIVVTLPREHRISSSPVVTGEK